jgi:hypothetical protein
VARPHRLQEQGAGKDGSWGAVLARPLFARAGDGGSASLAHLTTLFVERHHALWKVRALLFTSTPIWMVRPQRPLGLGPARQLRRRAGGRARAALVGER